MVQASPDGLLIIDGDVISYANHAMEQLAGVAEGALAGRPVEVLLPSVHRTRHRRLRRQDPTSASLMGPGADLSLLTADGTVLPVEVALAPLPTDGRELVVATVRDVSERRALQVERARMAHVLQIVPDAVIVVDAATGLVLDVNPAAGVLLGDAPSALQGTPAAALSADGDGEFLRRSSAGLTVARIRTRDGRVVECEVHTATFDAPGRTEVANVVRDVSDRLRLERRTRALETALRAVFDRAPVGLAMTRRNAQGQHTIVRTNDAFAGMFGYRPQELDGKEPTILHASREQRDGTTASGLDDGNGLVGITATRKYRRRDGTTVWAEVQATELAEDEDEGDVQRFLVTALDVTERVELDRTRRLQGIVTECIADVANAALAHDDASKVFELIARGALEAMEADAVVIFTPVPEHTTTRVLAAAGPLAARLVDGLHATPSLGEGGLDERPKDGSPGFGAVIAVPFGPDESLATGRLVVSRALGRPAFSGTESTELARLAAHTQVALHLARARDDQQRLILVEERQRIARDLHDTVIQDMIALGMEMSAEASTSSGAGRRAREDDHLDRLESMVDGLRRAVFQLRDPTSGRSLAREVTDAVAQASRLLPTAPSVTLAGPLELVTTEVLDDLVAVLREAMSNVARHAQATRVAVSVTVTDTEVVLVVDDDGVGFSVAPKGGFGILSITERARRHAGSVNLGPGPITGTTMTWRCPLEG